jgi:signal transduction histidine kinase
MAKELIDRLASLPSLSRIPRSELKWLVENGQAGVYDVGMVIGPRDKPIENLWIIISGKIAIRVDRGAGPKLVMEWQTGDVTGLLPYSRMSSPPGDTCVEEKLEVILINRDLFPDMIHLCPSFTALTVHSMLDRVRNFNTSDLQDEKMISLGKLSAGLAHELNNPASATVRNAKMLLAGLNNLETASRDLGAAGLSGALIKEIEKLRTTCLENAEDASLSPIQKAEHLDLLTAWLDRHRLNTDFALPLVDTCITIDQLDKLAGPLSENALEKVVTWLAASCTAHALAAEIELGSTQIHQVVEAVKKFTFMDNLSVKELVDIETGIRDTLSILVAKSRSKKAEIIFDFAAGLPKAYANGSDLNQVWFSLLDNALDAIPHAGSIRISAAKEGDRVVIRITDNGPGIPSANLSKIFDPFFTTKAPGQGTGLGLDIARRLLRRYAGDITVTSRPGRTEFCVSLLIRKK